MVNQLEWSTNWNGQPIGMVNQLRAGCHQAPLRVMDTHEQDSLDLLWQEVTGLEFSSVARYSGRITHLEPPVPGHVVRALPHQWFTLGRGDVNERVGYGIRGILFDFLHDWAQSRGWRTPQHDGPFVTGDYWPYLDHYELLWVAWSTHAQPGELTARVSSQQLETIADRIFVPRSHSWLTTFTRVHAHLLVTDTANLRRGAIAIADALDVQEGTYRDVLLSYATDVRAARSWSEAEFLTRATLS
jgi:hypothetical protein